jgi:hypothetical protein
MRPVVGADNSIIQQGLTTEAKDYKHMEMYRCMLGVILEVVPVDRDENRSGMQTVDRKGHTHECSVLVINDGTSAYMTLENVIITPDSPSGLDDFEERLPRGSSSLVTGAEYDPNIHSIDPYDLDGDWCVIAFLGGKIDSPFVLRYWPHARNTFDAATSGKGLEGDTLVQQRRYFRRTNGVESVITSKGDIIISTTYANSVLTPSEEPADGRVARTLDEDVGGSIRVNIKPSQSIELNFNPLDQGVGIVDETEPELPQLNPWQEEPVASDEKPDTYIYMDRDQVDFIVTTSVTVTTQDTITLVAENLVELGAEQIHLGIDAEEGIPRDDRLQAQLDEIAANIADLQSAHDTHIHITTATEGASATVGTIAPPQIATTETYSVGDTATDLTKGI